MPGDQRSSFGGGARRRGRLLRAGAFTLMETLVVILIVIVLLSIFVPYGLSLRESSRRAACANNLRQLRDALQAYAWTEANARSFPRVVHDPERPDGYTAFSGPDAPDPFAPDSPVRPNDVTASLWLLVREGLVTDTRVFVCPSAGGRRDGLTDASGRPVEPKKRGNFRAPGNLSYSYASPFSSAAGYRLSATLLNGFALLADKNPGSLPAADAQRPHGATGNSRNHGGAGQNVLYAEGVVEFRTTPFCGIGNDNIYSARATSPTTQTAELPADVPGVVARDASPVGNDDSYLVPTEQDVPPTTMPAR